MIKNNDEICVGVESSDLLDGEFNIKNDGEDAISLRYICTKQKKIKNHLLKKYLIILPTVMIFYNFVYIRQELTYEIDRYEYYEVNEGDTLWEIAKEYLGSSHLYWRIAHDNSIENPNLIYPGQTLKLHIQEIVSVPYNKSSE